MRIVAGDWKGRRIDSAPGSRPTAGKVREALLSIWQERVRGARVLDLFCGGGAVGLEAASRGAASIAFVDRDRRAIDTVIANSRALGLSAFATHRCELPGGLGARERFIEASYDLIFADPPYAFTDYESLLAAAAPLMVGDGWLAVEHAAGLALASDLGSLVRTEERRYGSSSVSFFGTVESLA